MTEFVRKLLPFTVSVKLAPPAVAVVGEMAVSTGVGFVAEPDTTLDRRRNTDSFPEAGFSVRNPKPFVPQRTRFLSIGYSSCENTSEASMACDFSP
jgi:hypothetical protein